jgi:hypothetical protein
MNDSEFKLQFARYDDLLGTMQEPEQAQRTRRHPDIRKAVDRVTLAAAGARAVMGSDDAIRYEESLIELRRAVGSWRTIDGGYGAVV